MEKSRSRVGVLWLSRVDRFARLEFSKTDRARKQRVTASNLTQRWNFQLTWADVVFFSTSLFPSNKLSPLAVVGGDASGGELLRSSCRLWITPLWGLVKRNRCVAVRANNRNAHFLAFIFTWCSISFRFYLNARRPENFKARSWECDSRFKASSHFPIHYAAHSCRNVRRLSQFDAIWFCQTTWIYLYFEDRQWGILGNSRYNAFERGGNGDLMIPRKSFKNSTADPDLKLQSWVKREWTEREREREDETKPRETLEDVARPVVELGHGEWSETKERVV